MELIDLLVNAAWRRDGLQVRSLAQDIVRAYPKIATIPRPQTADLYALAMAAALAELLALRRGQVAPRWTNEVGASPESFFLLEAAQSMRNLRHLCETESPEPLRKRQLYAPPDFLSFV